MTMQRAGQVPPPSAYLLLEGYERGEINYTLRVYETVRAHKGGTVGGSARGRLQNAYMPYSFVLKRRNAYR